MYLAPRTSLAWDTMFPPAMYASALFVRRFRYTFYTAVSPGVGLDNGRLV